MDGVLPIARTDAEGNAFWSARDLMPLMGHTGVNAWQNFSSNVIERARAAAQNVGVTCLFSDVTKKGTGGRNRADVHLDRMAAYLVAMNGNPNKPEAANYPRQLPPFSKRANLQPCSPHLGQRPSITH